MKLLRNVGMDIGSTTIKVVVTGDNGNVLFKDYRRHYADIEQVIPTVLTPLIKTTGDRPVHFPLPDRPVWVSPNAVIFLLYKR